jgi:hypothetical protein
MSALPPKPDIAERDQDVRFVPVADMRTAIYLFRNAHVQSSRSAVMGEN